MTNKQSFTQFTELVLANSGSLFEATKYAAPCEVSRGTIKKYLYILEQTFVTHIVRPYTSYAPSEIVSAPKVYGFDTGFVCHHRGWTSLRKEDMGLLWEHSVLNEILARFPKGRVRYWRDKAKHEIDFIYCKGKNGNPIAIECKWSANNFNGKSLHRFRSLYAQGENFVVATDVDRSFSKNSDGIKIEFCNLTDLVERLQGV